MKLDEIGHRVMNRREALGLSQGRLAKLAGLSRATINQLENGALRELGVAKLANLLDLLGLELHVSPPRRNRSGRSHPLLAASRTASVSYRSSIDPGQLAQALLSGEVPQQWLPHVATLLDEAPLPLVVSAVEEAATRARVPPQQVWRHVARIAQRFRSPRRAWS
jgi:transcriptional regulator with XRE-family HTH domain